jgi:hypothetical protein
MTTEKKKIVVVGEDKDIIKLLEIRYEIKEIMSFQTYETALEELLEEHSEDYPRIADFIIFNDNVLPADVFSLPPAKKVSDKEATLTRLYYLNMEMYYSPPKVIGVGTGALLLAKLNSADLLYNVTSHKETTHLNNFILPDGKILEFDVKSNHNHLILPGRFTTFNILAFSTYNASKSYTRINGRVFKATRDFVEIEAIQFMNSNSYCFLYDMPKKGQNVLTDLTLQLLKE